MARAAHEWESGLELVRLYLVPGCIVLVLCILLVVVLVPPFLKRGARYNQPCREKTTGLYPADEDKNGP